MKCVVKLIIPENIKNIKPYPPGKPLDELEREYGITNSIKLASNENPWGPSPKAVEAIGNCLSGLNRYPDGSGYYLTRAIAGKYGFEPSEIVLGNGSNEVIELLVKAFITEGDEVISSHPSFLMYQKFVQVRGGINHVIPLKDMKHDLIAILDKITDRTRLVFIDNPNNPTGNALPPKEIYEFISKVDEHVIVVLDEAYVDFMNPEFALDMFSLVRNTKARCPVVFLRTFSKAYGLSGVRAGFGLMPADIAVCLHKVRQPFNMNQLAQAGALAALEDEEYYQQTLKKTVDGLVYLQEEVNKLGCISYDTQTNFFLADVRGNSDKLYEALLHEGVIVRSMSSYGFTNFIRITVGTNEENIRFIKALGKCLKYLNYA